MTNKEKKLLRKYSNYLISNLKSIAENLTKKDGASSIVSSTIESDAMSINTFYECFVREKEIKKLIKK